MDHHRGRRADRVGLAHPARHDTITIVWTSSADRLAAAIVTAAWIDQEWLTKAQRAAAPAIVWLAWVDGD